MKPLREPRMASNGTLGFSGESEGALVDLRKEKKIWSGSSMRDCEH